MPTILTLKSYKASIKLLSKDKHIAASICTALVPDLESLQKDEDRVEVFLDGPSIVFKIETENIATLRASLNTYLRLSAASYECLQSC